MCVLILALTTIRAFAQIETQPARPAPNLGKGVNISHWLWLPHERAADFATRHITPADAGQLRELGFDHARVPIDPASIWDNEAGAVSEERVEAVLDAISVLTDAGLVAVLDVHPLDNTWPNANRPDGAARLKELWLGLSPLLARTNPRQIILELCNEPHDFAQSKQWTDLQTELHAIVRSACPEHTIMLTGDRYGSIDGLLVVEPIGDPNVIYSFHFYDSHSFTHQGASWGPEHWKTLRHVPFPGIGERMERAVRDAPPEARGAMQWYANERWTQGRVREQINKAIEWAAGSGVTVYCGEFGVYRPNSLEEDRERWLEAVAGTLNSQGIAWAMWDYDGGFALVEGKPGARTVHASTHAAIMRETTADTTESSR